MPREIELTIYGIDKGELVERLRQLNATFIGKYDFKTINFQFETKGSIKSLDTSEDDEQYYSTWVRIRTDGSRTTLTLKEQHGTTISKRMEFEVEVSDFLETVKIMMKLLPTKQYVYIESERDEYKLGSVTIDINKRPYLPYSIEIEAESEELVREAYRKLGIKKEPMKSLAVSDSEFYKLFGVDYEQVSQENAKKLSKMLEGIGE